MILSFFLCEAVCHWALIYGDMIRISIDISMVMIITLSRPENRHLNVEPSISRNLNINNEQTSITHWKIDR